MGRRARLARLALSARPGLLAQLDPPEMTEPRARPVRLGTMELRAQRVLSAQLVRPVLSARPVRPEATGPRARAALRARMVRMDQTAMMG